MEPKQIKISSVLHLAADHYLSHNELVEPGPNNHFSCNAIKDALRESLGFKQYVPPTSNQHELFSSHFLIIEAGLRNLGLKSPGGGRAFEELERNYTHTVESQSARYIWLKWAALMAEEQGV